MIVAIAFSALIALFATHINQTVFIKFTTESRLPSSNGERFSFSRKVLIYTIVIEMINETCFFSPATVILVHSLYFFFLVHLVWSE